MPIVVATKNSKFELAPEGPHRAVFADVEDLGAVETAFGIKERIRLKWLLEQKEADGVHHLSVIQTVNRSLHEKSALYGIVKALGRHPGLKQLDLETLIGANALLVISHKAGSNGQVYPNIASVTKPPDGKYLAVPADFKRKQNKDPWD